MGRTTANALQNLTQPMNKPMYVKRCCQCQVFTYTDVLTSYVEEILCQYNKEAESEICKDLCAVAGVYVNMSTSQGVA